MADEITDEDLVEAATAPQSATVDGQSATAHSLADQLEVARHTAANNAVRGSRGGWPVMRKGIPPGGGL